MCSVASRCPRGTDKTRCKECRGGNLYLLDFMQYTRRGEAPECGSEGLDGKKSWMNFHPELFLTPNPAERDKTPFDVNEYLRSIP